VASLRRALARERTGRADAARSAATAEARHGQEIVSSQADLAAAEASNEALRRANVALAESRTALREREERLRLILASATDYAIFTMDVERRVPSWNEGAERLLGWAEAEIAGRPADVIFTPEDRAVAAPEREAEAALRGGRAADDRWHLRKDGSRFWANGLMLPLRDPQADPAGPADGLLKITRDETERRRAEEQRRCCCTR
jgi:PAS domain S-box-containing protein